VIKLSVNKLRNTLRASAALAAASLGAAAMPVAVALPAVALPIAALAQSSPGSAFAPDAPPTAYRAQRGSLSLAQATAMAQSRYQGRVVRAEAVQQGNRVIYEIRILGDDGRVRTVRVDAETGAVM
jgi:uncharacterized membrane protein YkoI